MSNLKIYAFQVTQATMHIKQFWLLALNILLML